MVVYIAVEGFGYVAFSFRVADATLNLLSATCRQLLSSPFGKRLKWKSRNLKIRAEHK